MKKDKYRIMFFAYDPGGVNVLLPIINEIDKEKYEINVFGKRRSKHLFLQAGVACNYLRDKYCDIDSLTLFLENGSYAKNIILYLSFFIQRFSLFPLYIEVNQGYNK